MHGDFWSRDKDGGHAIRSAVAKNLMLHANLTSLSALEPELLLVEVYIAGIGFFELLFL